MSTATLLSLEEYLTLPVREDLVGYEYDDGRVIELPAHNSPNDTAAEIERKVDQYLAAGVTAVILLYPDSRHVRVCRSNGETRRLGAGEALEIPELLPGFKLPIDELFATGGSS